MDDDAEEWLHELLGTFDAHAGQQHDDSESWLNELLRHGQASAKPRSSTLA